MNPRPLVTGKGNGYQRKQKLLTLEEEMANSGGWTNEGKVAEPIGLFQYQSKRSSNTLVWKCFYVPKGIARRFAGVGSTKASAQLKAIDAFLRGGKQEHL